MSGTVAPGVRLGPYEVLSAVGTGGMGEIYRARDLRLERDVAVKVLPAALVADTDALARFGHALSDPTRTRGLLTLRDGPAYPADLAVLYLHPAGGVPPNWTLTPAPFSHSASSVPPSSFATQAAVGFAPGGTGTVGLSLAGAPS